MKKKILSVLRKPFYYSPFGRAARKFTLKAHYLFLFLSRAFMKLYSENPYLKRLDEQVSRNRLIASLTYYADLEDRLKNLSYQPKISILIPIYKTPYKFLRETLLSVEMQIYPNWEICAVDDDSQDPELEKIVNETKSRFPGQVKFERNKSNLHISLTSNECFKLASGDYIALLDHDDRLYPQSLAEMIRFINIHSKPDILYSDERVINEQGAKVGGVFSKPAWSPLFHLTTNYTTHFTLYSREIFLETKGFRQGYEGAQDHDLMLRATELTKKPVVHISTCLYQWRAHAASTAGSLDSKPYALQAGVKSVTEAWKRRGYDAEVSIHPETLQYRSKLILKTQPLISIIIPSKNGLHYLSKCLNSIYAKSTYKNFEIIISDNGSTDPEVLKLYTKYSSSHPGTFQASVEEHNFNFGRQINRGANLAKGDYLLLLNNDIEVITPEWIEEMLQFAQLSDVGAVGAKLLYPGSEKIQHAGLVMIGHHIASHFAINSKPNSNIYCNFLNAVHETTGVTGACLMIAKSKFQEVNAHDERDVPCGYGDVKFCLDLQRKGYRNVFTPFAVLYHHESPSRSVNIEFFELMYMRKHYAVELLNDSVWSPNLFLEHSAMLEARHIGLCDLGRDEMKFLLETPKEQWLRLAREMA